LPTIKNVPRIIRADITRRIKYVNSPDYLCFDAAARTAEIGKAVRAIAIITSDSEAFKSIAFNLFLSDSVLFAFIALECKLERPISQPYFFLVSSDSLNINRLTTEKVYIQWKKISLCG
jgi:hypothetical protein